MAGMPMIPLRRENPRQYLLVSRYSAGGMTADLSKGNVMKTTLEASFSAAENTLADRLLALGIAADENDARWTARMFGHHPDTYHLSKRLTPAQSSEIKDEVMAVAELHRAFDTIERPGRADILVSASNPKIVAAVAAKFSTNLKGSGKS